ncbi:HalOD1 output domain-containing protein [Halopiger djelfimassiliensis]|uniref:HalOD1 output domain-containing protein n=1 Tax=Halopiger djelfimassiliensis TaxID=1293047 RepID=UPI00067789F6|nr:HalOD1 output domain-containing protein [Halopiger djelfimassiliensis]
MHSALATVLTRIAAHEDRDRTALPPLYDAIDPEALTTVLESNADVTVRFEYEGYRVVIGPHPDEVTVIAEDR